ncbi:hypothetical protein [Mesorhizobium sp.]|uniref:hypothetical protein n=1 Tax=Mesorhizobium sp. TaxID=1871066 RepID=UPI0025E1E251|nr:hypothetical protein [Mesorhizobium sp.]
MSDRRLPHWVREIVTEVAVARETTPNVILMDFRHDKACFARREAIYRIKVQKPSLSSPQIGKWFDKNPATILYSLARHAEQTGAERLSEYSLKKWKPTGKRVGRPRKAQ